MKLILALLVALSLIGSPGVAVASPPVDCTMTAMGKDMAADHEKMGCCTPNCAVASPAALLPASGSQGGPVEHVSGAYWPPVAGGRRATMLLTEDPPPRTFFA